MRLNRDLMAAGDGAGSFCLQKYKLYETRSKFFMIGWDKTRTIWKVLSIDRLEPSELNIREDPAVYTETECEDLLNRIHNGNRSSGGLRFVTQCYGIIGFVKFLGPYYLLLITKRQKIGSICGHAVFAISKSKIIAIPNPTVSANMPFSKDENRYRKLLCMVDLTRDFFFSYSFNIMRSLQKNLCDVKSGDVLYETMFVWNEFLTRGIRNNLKSTLWTVALVHGFFKQVKLSISGKDFVFTLIARRSRHYAGTRYLKRGVNEKGRVANEVETEQIVFDASSKIVPEKISSVVQIRGSIPLFWSQDSSWLNMKPDIILEKDQNYEATRLHFDNLMKRYENPIIIFNLIKTYERRPRESILRAEFAKAIDFINRDLPAEQHLRFLHWDLSKHFRRAKNVLELLVKLGSDALCLTGFFYWHVPSSLRMPGPLSLHFLVNDGNHNKSSDAIFTGDGYQNDNEGNSGFSSRNTSQSNLDQYSSFSKPPMLQKGVLRTNCIDCLDRTNVAQYAYGLAALGQQLHALDLIDVPMINLGSPLSDDVMDLYEKMGDTLSLQYVGSAAHNKIFCERRGQWKAATQSQEFFRTVQRYYSNTYMDPLKQDAINVFLGHFQPQEGRAALWELGSDQHYNIGRHADPFTGENTKSFIKRSLSEGNILCESDTPSSSSKAGERSPQNMHTSVDTKGLSESTPEMPTSERVVSYSKFDESSFSNFLDLDHISSSGNSCEEEFYERSSLINSPVEKLSSENVIIELNAETPSNLSWDGSSCKNGTVTEVEQSRVGDQNIDIGEFSERFHRWVDHGGSLCF
ncbi:phosphoinositide phosphatase SAC4-like isoform X2 [Phalaenopsis equestris]|uniref:phosphoinositide phosphatase SAC4-like isoform X2 n=1 Tax=Phalaenopsis equestris TaxID=78828 RepID=UPI0009E46AF8|nr:phosphoinositide phosphatase SAC4-like isoform X2 [Phalaenopsis equestris]